MVKAEMPKAVNMNTGSKLWMSSEDTSISKLTKPSAQIARGIGGLAGD
jgi:hypothetical protein